MDAFVEDAPPAAIHQLPSLHMPAGVDPYACSLQPGGSFLLSSTKYLVLEPITVTVDLPREFLDAHDIQADCHSLEENTRYCETAHLPDDRCPQVMDYFVSCTGSSICKQLFPAERARM